MASFKRENKKKDKKQIQNKQGISVQGNEARESKSGRNGDRAAIALY